MLFDKKSICIYLLYLNAFSLYLSNRQLIYSFFVDAQKSVSIRVVLQLIYNCNDACIIKLRIRCCSLRRGVAAGCRRRGRDATSTAGSGDADADAERAPGRTVDPLAADIRANYRGISAEWFRAAGLATFGR